MPKIDDPAFIKLRSRGYGYDEVLDILNITKNSGSPEFDADVSGDIVCWGDSLTAGAGGGGTTYPAALGLATSRVVRNSGVGGESSSGIAARQGSLPYLMLPQGGAIPANGGVTVTFTVPAGDVTWPLLQGDGNPDGAMTGTLAGVPGTLTLTQPSGPSYTHLANDFYTFTRTTPGSVVPVTRPTPFVLDYAIARRGDTAIVWAGRNNFSDSGVRAQRDIRAMRDYLSSELKQALIVGVLNGRGEGAGTASRTSIDALNSLLLGDYGYKFLDLRSYLVAYGLSDAGITPTDSDIADMNAGIVPGSLRSDAVHLTAAGYIVVANAIAKRLYDLGWVGTYTPVAYPTPPAPMAPNVLVNSEFETDLNGWSGAAASVITRDAGNPYSGLASVKVDLSSDINAALNQEIANVPAGVRPFMQASVKPVAYVAGRGSRCILHCYDINSAYVGNVTITANHSATDWTVLSGKTVGATPAGTVRGSFQVNKFNNDQNLAYSVWIDSLHLDFG